MKQCYYRTCYTQLTPSSMKTGLCTNKTLFTKAGIWPTGCSLPPPHCPASSSISTIPKGLAATHHLEGSHPRETGASSGAQASTPASPPTRHQRNLGFSVNSPAYITYLGKGVWASNPNALELEGARPLRPNIKAWKGSDVPKVMQVAKVF